MHPERKRERQTARDNATEKDRLAERQIVMKRSVKERERESGVERGGREIDSTQIDRERKRKI